MYDARYDRGHLSPHHSCSVDVVLDFFLDCAAYKTVSILCGFVAALRLAGLEK